MEWQQIIHPFAPLYDENSEILILGTLPSAKSREDNFFYGHPQNRFWKVLSAVLGEALPRTAEEKTALLLRNHIALWDVIYSCEIRGSSDSTIRNVIPSDLRDVLEHSKIRKIYTNGTKSAQLYKQYHEKELGISAVSLPSTSPANAAWSFERLCGAWSVIRPDTE